MAEQRYGDAVDLFSRAESLVHAPPHLLYMARALAAQGKLVRAQETYVKLGRDVVPASAPKAFHDAQNDGAKELAELEKRIPYLKVVLEGASAAKVTMDGTPISSALIGLSRPVDPGEHVLYAEGEGVASDKIPIVLKEGAHETATLTLKPIATAAIYTPVDLTPKPAPAPASDSTHAPAGHGLRTAGFVAIGLGVVGMGVGTFFVLQNNDKRNQADQICASGVCPLGRKGDVTSLDSDADNAATFAWIGYAAGGVALATGAVLWFLDTKQHKQESASRVHVTPWIGPRMAGLAGTFE